VTDIGWKWLGIMALLWVAFFAALAHAEESPYANTLDDPRIFIPADERPYWKAQERYRDEQREQRIDRVLDKLERGDYDVEER
jgi:hypothetical protein